ncbi:unnamed protein product [Coregonus sp. 'balchen']|nr:unnamed protein product [Coregonus sp. 'balchen']
MSFLGKMSGHSGQSPVAVDSNGITPFEQMLASCSWALLTSLFGKCFVYCNGLMDHTCVCTNGNSKAWYKAAGHFNGTLSVGSVTVISPLELIRTKMQAQRHSYRELSEVICSAVRNEGWRSLWRGWGPTLLRDVPFSDRFHSNAALRRSEDQEAVSSKASSSTLSVMTKIVAENGVGGLFVGFLPRVIKVAPACAIMISCYEFGKAFFRKHNQERLLTSNT